MPLDFFARQPHYIDHLAPVWKALPSNQRGIFTVAAELIDYAHDELGNLGKIEVYNSAWLSGDCPILTAGFGDMLRAARESTRKIISMEHGTGHAFGKAAYPNGKGRRDLVNLFLMPNEYTARLSRSVRATRCEVIGTPKMDEWARGQDLSILIQEPKHNPPVIAIAFHWGNKHAKPPESGSAFEHYKDILSRLAKSYNIIGHGHPLAAHIYKAEFERAGIEWVVDFREVLRRADVYINDLSSTMYEFLVTGKPVIVLNAPWFRREARWGIRFWDYSDVGINVENPDELFGAIDRTLAEYGTIYENERRRAVRDLYPYAGCSAERAAEVITAYLDDVKTEDSSHAVFSG